MDKCRQSFFAWAVLAATSIGTWQTAWCQPTNQTSVEQLTALLQTIDPYRPTREVRGTVRVYGSTSMDALAHGWAGGFKKFHPNVRVEITGTGYQETFDRLQQDPDGVGMIARPVTEAELAELKQRGLNAPHAFVVAREALGVFVHAQNPVQSISGEQLRQVFTMDGPPGLTWGLLGAPGSWASQPIHIVSRVPNSGTQDFLANFVFKSAEMRPGVSEHVSNAQVLEVVREDPLAIAICGIRSKAEGVKALQLMAAGTAVPSDDQTILTGQYPLTRPLTLVVDLGQKTPDGLAAQEFVRYALCQSGQVQAVLVGFFPVDPPLLRAGLQKLDGSLVR
ncbi:MAG: hypothetical protein D6753_11935 [Planctomycetota bacterium]|nr:MAG: hypothetical protein D6753_11935 [Planctomycetota bacterium]